MLNISAGSSCRTVMVCGVPFSPTPPYGAGKALAVPSRSKNGSSGSPKPAHLVIPTRHISSFKTAVAAIDSEQLSSSSDSPDKQEANRYYFVVANAKFMLDEEEHFKELLSERLRNYGERNKERDFWLVIEPKFLDNFPNITKMLFVGFADDGSGPLSQELE